MNATGYHIRGRSTATARRGDRQRGEKPGANVEQGGLAVVQNCGDDARSPTDSGIAQGASPGRAPARATPSPRASRARKASKAAGAPPSRRHRPPATLPSSSTGAAASETRLVARVDGEPVPHPQRRTPRYLACRNSSYSERPPTDISGSWTIQTAAMSTIVVAIQPRETKSVNSSARAIPHHPDLARTALSTDARTPVEPVIATALLPAQALRQVSGTVIAY